MTGRLKTLAVTALILAGAVSAQGKIAINGPDQSGAGNARVVDILSIDPSSATAG